MTSSALLKTCEKFNKHIANYRCPLCQTGLRFAEPASFVCAKGHCYDISKKGYINFFANTKKQNYGKELFEYRQKIYEAGFYENVLHEIKLLMLDHSEKNPQADILDAGCGQGYYSMQLSKEPRFADCGFFAMDISKEAVMMAASPNDSVNWMVANLADMPLADKSMDVLLDILTPANYGQFNRVLKDNGMLIKLIPGANYLAEIRNRIEGQLVNRQFSNQRVADYLEEHFTITQRKAVRDTCDVSKEQLQSFVQMTPMTGNVDLTKVDFSGIHTITIDVEILAANKKAGGKDVIE